MKLTLKISVSETIGIKILCIREKTWGTCWIRAVCIPEFENYKYWLLLDKMGKDKPASSKREVTLQMVIMGSSFFCGILGRLKGLVGSFQSIQE